MVHSHITRTITRALAFGLLCALLVPSIAAAVTREAVASRGEVWIARQVPYSQQGYATQLGDLTSSSSLGWRRDCSGFVSMSLGLVTATGLPESPPTSMLPGRLTKISKSDLKTGDVILRPSNLVIDGKTVAYGHAVIFVRWTSTAKTSYVGYHQSSGQKKAVAQVIEYPFWSEKGFSAYRYPRIEESRMRRSRGWYSPVLPSVTALSAPVVVPEFMVPPIDATAPFTPMTP